MTGKIIHRCIAFVLAGVIVAGITVYLTLTLITHPLTSADASQLYTLIISYDEILENGEYNSRHIDFEQDDAETEEVLDLLHEYSYRKGFTLHSEFSGLSIILLAGDTFEEARFTSLNIGRDGTVRIGNDACELIGGEETSEKLIDALLPYIPAEN